MKTYHNYPDNAERIVKTTISCIGIKTTFNTEELCAVAQLQSEKTHLKDKTQYLKTKRKFEKLNAQFASKMQHLQMKRTICNK